MTTLLHLSDLHLEAPLSAAQKVVVELLFSAIAREIARAGEEPKAVVVTGDIFDTSSADLDVARQTLRDFCTGLRSATGKRAPVFILPGNHDRRRLGVIGPEDLSLFQALARAVGPDIHVLGNDTPFLAQLVPADAHGLPFHLVAYDSTVLYGGLVSAGGLIRQEDLLQITAEIDHLERACGEGKKPILLLMHHHLVPTPVTDLSHIELRRLPRRVGIVLEKGLRHLIAHGDREELTMTALGAGTALSTLCSLGRAVLVLHGHKHYPTARLVKGLRQGEGDILIGSAGSAGRVEHWRPTELPKEARVWPSFNCVQIDGSRVTIESIAFSDRKPDKPVQRRRLAEAECEGRTWELAPVPKDTDERPAPLDRNESRVVLLSNRKDGGATFDAEVERNVHWSYSIGPRPVTDVVEGLPDGAVHVVRAGVHTRKPLPARVQIPASGRLSYRIERAACRTKAEGHSRYGKLTAHEWMGLLVRHASKMAKLTLVNLPATRKRPFGSATSLTSGEERAALLTTSDEGISLIVEDCPPLTLLRIYWPLCA